MSALALVALLLLALLAALSVTLSIVQRPRRGRIAQYAPPAGMSLLVASVLTRTDKRAAAAELVNLALRKNVQFLAPDAGSSQLRIELLSGPPLAVEQQALLKAVFGEPRSKKSRRRVIGRGAKLGGAVRDVIAAVVAGLRQEGLVVFDGRWPTVVLRVAAVASLGAYAIGIFQSPDMTLAGFVGVGAAALAALSLFAAPKGIRTFSSESFVLRDHLAGLNDYIVLAEADRLRFLQSPNGALRHSVDSLKGRVEALHLNEKLLPYAVLFGHEKEWAKLLDVERRELEASEMIDILDVTRLGYELVNSASSVSAAELVDALDGLDIDFSLMADIDLPDFDLSAFSFDL